VRGIYALFTIAFMAWAFGFGFLAAADFFRAVQLPNVGVGTSAAVMMSELMWIGGCVVLGGAALIFKPTTLPDVEAAAPPQLRAESPSDWPSDPSMPRAGNHTLAAKAGTSTHAGREYHLYGDGRVLALISDKLMTWQSESGFKAWAEREWDERSLSRGSSNSR